MNIFQKIKENIQKYKRNNTIIASDTIRRNASDEINDLYKKYNLEILSVNEIDRLSRVVGRATEINKIYKEYMENLKNLEAIKLRIDELENDPDIIITEIIFKTINPNKYNDANIPYKGAGTTTIVAHNEKSTKEFNEMYRGCIIDIFKAKYIMTLCNMSKISQNIRDIISDSENKGYNNDEK